MKNEVWLVYATKQDGRQIVMMAFYERADAEAHAKRCQNPYYDEGRKRIMPPVTSELGVESVGVRSLRVN